MSQPGRDILAAFRLALRIDARCRWRETELLDDHDGDPAQVAPTLRNLASINRLLSGMPGLCARHIVRDPGVRTIVDLGAGGADLARWLSARLRGAGGDVRIVCIDSDPRVVAYARRQCASDPAISVEHGDVLDAGVVPDGADWIICNHLLHHLDDRGVRAVLRMAHARARRGFIFNDLVRSRLAAITFACLGAVAFRGGVTLPDGVLSIGRALTIDELTVLVGDALPSVKGVTVARSGPGHLCVIARR